MKRNLYRIIFLSAIMMLFAPSLVPAQEKTDSSAVQESRLTFSYLCTSNDSVCLTANLFVKKESDTYGLKNATIEFLSTQDNKFIPLGSAVTDQDGTAILSVVINKLHPGKDGMISYTAKFAGTLKYTKTSATFIAEPAKLRLAFNVQDSIRYLNVIGTRKDPKGQDVALPKETVILYIPRLFSLLKIGEVALDEQGKASFEFPGDIVGDTLGNLNIIAKIEENEKYGFVQGTAIINWGVPKQYYKAEVPSRELWTPIAPLWMIITLIIMLAGVWAHYVYAVWELIMIKQASKKDQPPL
ncbi:MAG: hypothetical protein NTY96_12145 [Bacteroidetes bacterium]|nr:hypothetical protein [Bacteroidota bacterium]